MSKKGEKRGIEIFPNVAAKGEKSVKENKRNIK